MNIYFRVDASTEMGTGHVMRCLTLADSLSELGVRCRFICKPLEGNMIEYLFSKGYEVSILSFCNRKNNANLMLDANSNLNWLVDAEECKKILSRSRCDWVIVDNYSLDFRWEEVVKNHCSKIMVIDDLANRRHSSNILLDQSLRLSGYSCYQNLVPANCKLLLGPSHAIIRPEFNEISPRVRTGVVEKIFVYFGGNDIFNQAGNAVNAIKQYKALSATVVLGMGHPFQERLRTEGCERVNIVNHCENMAAVMNQSDLGLGVCGGAAWERCAVGLPSIVCITADNQKVDTISLTKLGAVINIGESSSIDTDCWVRALDYVTSNPYIICSMGVKALEVVDGYKSNQKLLLNLLGEVNA